ncbi:MAG: hypothetical protein MUF48_16525 [Pirellulaceae bacterium]|jgi:7,8-dihydropterin-6-yl-methyl-4-(beta-D-ribofuranosyl)aminobenzene 5'-phosphate synthase|nr:hypothetical protein [Pirellulaceae bacterium]
MVYRVSPWMWPALALASPALVPSMLRRHRVFKANSSRAETLNRERIAAARALELPVLDRLDLTVLVDEKTSAGFRGDPGVSYLICTEMGTLLFD